MESLCCSANKESEDAYDVSTSLTQNIVTNFGERSREGLTNGLNRALEVGYLSGSLEYFKVRRPKGSEGYPELTVRESPDELTLRGVRGEEVGTWKSYINVDHIETLVDYDWHAFCQVLF